jgi:hypothetical protein
MFVLRYASSALILSVDGAIMSARPERLPIGARAITAQPHPMTYRHTKGFGLNKSKTGEAGLATIEFLL